MASPADADTVVAGYKVGTLFAIGAGSSVVTMLMGGPWYARIVAGVSGACMSFVGTPIITPIAFRFWQEIYVWIGVDPAALSRDSVAGFAGFVLALTGIDICRWLIERIKSTLWALRIPLDLLRPRKDGGADLDQSKSK